MGEWSDADLETELKDKLELLSTLYNKQKADQRNTSKCISQIMDIRQVQKSTSVDDNGKVTITYDNPANPSGNIMADDYRNEQITALIDNIDAYLSKFEYR